MFVLDELYVPSGKTPGGGFFGEMTATATGATSITGTNAAADSSQATGEWIHFQIRITEDTGTPTAVGQRRKITANTNANPIVYTVAAWGVEPSETAKYVVEGIGDVVCITGAATVTHTYAMGGFRADGNWSTGATAGAASLQLAAHAANTVAGVTGEWMFGVTALDTAKSARYSHCHVLRGGGVITLDVLDIAANSWSNAVAYGGSGPLFAAGTSSVYNPNTLGGKYLYINQSGLTRFYRLDMLNRVLEPYCYLPIVQGTALVGNKMAWWQFIDGSTYVGAIVHWMHTGAGMYELLLLV
jgi:hypothetical protein